MVVQVHNVTFTEKCTNQELDLVGWDGGDGGRYDLSVPL